MQQNGHTACSGSAVGSRDPQWQQGRPEWCVIAWRTPHSGHTRTSVSKPVRSYPQARHWVPVYGAGSAAMKNPTANTSPP